MLGFARGTIDRRLVTHRMSRRRSWIAAFTGVIAVVLTACGGGAGSGGSGHTGTPSATPTPVPPLAAPVIVQVENLSAARPQAGLSVADVVYEYDTEGGISRFSAMYFQPPAGVTIGPVRSARLVTLKLVQAYGATLLYSGGSAYVVQALQNSGVRQYDETSAAGVLYRVNTRDAPHNLYTDGTQMAALQQRAGGHTVSYKLWGRTAPTALPPGGTPASKFTVPVSDSETPQFTYDTATGGYQRAEPDTGVLTDSDSAQPWEPKTIVVLGMQVTTAPEVEDVSGAHGLDFGLQGGGDGQIAVGGRLYPIKWTQGPNGPPQLTLSNGAAAPVAPGQVLIELVQTGQTVTVG